MTFRKSIRTISIASVIAVLMSMLALQCVADEPKPIFTVDFPQFYSEIATNDKATAQITKGYVEDGVECLKVVPNTNSSSSDDIVLDTYINIKNFSAGFASSADFAIAMTD